jgi:hypothetical protein
VSDAPSLTEYNDVLMPKFSCERHTQWATQSIFPDETRANCGVLLPVYAANLSKNPRGLTVSTAFAEIRYRKSRELV